MDIYQQFIATRTYCRWLEKENRRESFQEAIDRYTDYFSQRIPDDCIEEFHLATKFISSLDVMPSMRCLWTAGPALDREAIAGYNCAFLTIDNYRAFAEVLYILMNGTGVGFSVERQFVSKLPSLPEEFKKCDKHNIVFSDSKRGWAEGFLSLLKSLYQGFIPEEIDYSRIRPEGARLKTFGGRASGKRPLKQLCEFTINILTNAKGRKLSSLECYDLTCFVANCVVVGGVRRSATISLSNLSDDKMRHAKDGQFWNLHPYRALSNNSVAYTEKPSSTIFLEEWNSLIKGGSGERGIINREAFRKKVEGIGREYREDMGVNPCFHPDTYISTVKGLIKIKDIKEPVEVYSMDSNGNMCIKQASAAWKTKEDADTITISYDGGNITVTPDHKIWLAEKGWVESSKITLEESVLLLTTNGYKSVKVTKVEKSEPVDVYDISVEDTHCLVANGIVAHNCGEIILRPNEFCNLSEVVIKSHDDVDSLKPKVRAAVIFGMLQSTLTKFNFIRKEWIDNTEEERLLGVSITGVCDNPTLKPEDYKTLRDYAHEVAAEWADKLAINKPKAITCVKPSGTVSQLVNSASGLHPRFSNFYIRRVRVNAKDPLANYLVDKGVPWSPEVSQTEEDHTTKVFAFPIKSPDNCVVKDDMDAIDQLNHWRMLAENWTDHNPSATIYVADEEWVEVGAWVYRNWDKIGGLSFLPRDGNNYPLMPYEEITEEEYNRLKKSFPDDIDFVNELRLWEKEDATEGSREFACTGDKCEL